MMMMMIMNREKIILAGLEMVGKTLYAIACVNCRYMDVY